MRIASRYWPAILAATLALWAGGARSASGPPPLVLERTIPLAGVAGRIDHLALDPRHRRLFVAELGNGTVEAIDLARGRSLGRITGLQEPQGVAYLAGRDEIAVTTGGDGMVRFYRAGALSLVGALKLGEDADDVRVEPASGRVLVGFGHGLAVVNPARRSLVRSIALPAHPEGFAADGDRAYVNLPDAGAVAVLDLAQGQARARWRNPGPHFNFPLALDPAGGRIASAYRLPGKLVLFATSGRVQQQLDTCGDADDVFFDAPRRRVYVICGRGAVDVFARAGAAYQQAGRIATRSGARTGLFSPELDRLFVAARAHGAAPAAVLVFRPTP